MRPKNTLNDSIKVEAATEIPRLVRSSRPGNTRTTPAFALQATGAFWFYRGLTDINIKT